MKLFKSRSNLFELNVTDEWEYSYNENVYSFFNKAHIQGVLQISGYYNKDTTITFNINTELKKEKAKHPLAEVIKVSKYQAVHYGINSINDSTLQYFWITGTSNIKLFITLKINSKQAEEKLDLEYQTVVFLLNTLKINPTSIALTEES